MELKMMGWAIALAGYKPMGNEFLEAVLPSYPPSLLANLIHQWQRLTSPQEFINEGGEAIATSIGTWLQDHPILAWFLAHPLISLGLVAIALLLLWSLFQALVEITQDFWVWALGVPLILGRWMIRGSLRGLAWAIHRIGISLPSSTPPSTHTSASQEPIPFSQDTWSSLEPSSLSEFVEQDAQINPDAATIVTLLQRLEELTQEQNQVLHRIAQLAEKNYQTKPYATTHDSLRQNNRGHDYGVDLHSLNQRRPPIQADDSCSEPTSISPHLGN